MLRVLGKVQRIGIITESLPPQEEPVLRAVGAELQEAVAARFRGSLAIRQVDAGSCNGCELEIQALGNAVYNLAAIGVRLVASPRHADILLVTGPVTRAMADPLRMAYDAIPDPKRVVALGDCACGCGVYTANYATVGAVGCVLPVDLTIPGCPPPPEIIYEAFAALMRP